MEIPLKDVHPTYRKLFRAVSKIGTIYLTMTLASPRGKLYDITFVKRDITKSVLVWIQHSGKRGLSTNMEAKIHGLAAYAITHKERYLKKFKRTGGRRVSSMRQVQG